MKLKIEYLDKQDLKPYLNNAKIHTPEQIEQIKKSIQQFGFNDPVAIWKDNQIIEGHGRLLAVMQMQEIQQIPVIRLNDLTDQQRKAYAIIHNSLILQTGFDIALLEQELQDIKDIDMTQYDFSIQPQTTPQDLQDFFIDEDINRTPKEKTVECPCCGRTINIGDLNDEHFVPAD